VGWVRSLTAGALLAQLWWGWGVGSLRCPLSVSSFSRSSFGGARGGGGRGGRRGGRGGRYGESFGLGVGGALLSYTLVLIACVLFATSKGRLGLWQGCRLAGEGVLPFYPPPSPPLLRRRARHGGVVACSPRGRRGGGRAAVRPLGVVLLPFGRCSSEVPCWVARVCRFRGYRVSFGLGGRAILHRRLLLGFIPICRWRARGLIVLDPLARSSTYLPCLLFPLPFHTLGISLRGGFEVGEDVGADCFCMRPSSSL